MLETEHDNLKAALHWSRALGETVAALRIAVGSAWFWCSLAARVEGFAHEALAEHPPMLARLLG